MIATHKGIQAFAAQTRLGTKEPDRLTTCNTVQSKKRFLLKTSKVNLAENDKKIYMKEITVPKNIELSSSRGVRGLT